MDDSYRRIPVMLHSIDAEGRIEDVSDAWLDVLGYDRDEVIGRFSTEFLTPESRRHAQEVALPEFFRTGRCRNLSYDMLRRDGSVIRVRMSANSQRRPDGSFWRSLAVTTDVTAEENLRSLFDNSIDLLCVASFDGYFLELNPAWTRTLGFSADEMKIPMLTEFIHPDDRDTALAEFDRLTEGEPVLDLVARFRTSSGGYRTLTWTALPSLARGRFYAVGRDVTEQRRAEEERRRLEARLHEAQRSESLAVLAGGIAHDFNNLLTSMLGNAELALGRLDDDAPVVPELRRIQHSALRAADLCSQMLAYSGRGLFEVRTVDLSGIVAAMSELTDASSGRGVGLELALASDLPPVRVDVSQLRQLILNLTTNASDAIGDSGGRITIRTGAQEVDATPWPSTHGDPPEPGSYVFVDVQDDGRGMDADTSKSMFDPFFSTKFAGRGLGLAAVLGIVRGHRGALRVESEPGRGTRIRVLFPALREERAESAAGSSEGDWRGRGQVLVVDDERAVRVVAQKMLESVGFEVTTAASGPEALERLEDSGSWTVVLMDVTMPKMDGRETARRILSVAPHARLVFMSGFSAAEATSRYQLDGLGGFVHKPFTREQLVTAVRRELDRAVDS